MKKLLTLALSLALTAAVGVASANTKLTVGASATPHAEILEAAKPLLAEKGIDLEIVVFDDYVQPNLQLEAGDLDANYFQHIPYLENFNNDNGTHLVSAGAVHYEPMTNTFRIFGFLGMRLSPSYCSLFAMTMARKSSNRYFVSHGPPQASGWNCTENAFFPV